MSKGAVEGQNSFVSWSRYAAVITTILLAIGAYLVQWGVVVTKLDQIDNQITDMAKDVKTMWQANATLERRISFLEGRIERGGS